MRDHLRITVITTLLVVAVAATDLATKLASVAITHHGGMGLIRTVHNAGFSGGFFGAPAPVMVTLAVIGIGLIGWWTLRLAYQGALAVWVPGVLLGGALGNLVDRMASGTVHDFIVLPFATANVADFAVLGGLIGYLATRQHLRVTERR